jgi:hypothetical protein
VSIPEWAGDNCDPPLHPEVGSQPSLTTHEMSGYRNRRRSAAIAARRAHGQQNSAARGMVATQVFAPRRALRKQRRGVHHVMEKTPIGAGWARADKKSSGQARPFQSVFRVGGFAKLAFRLSPIIQTRLTTTTPKKHARASAATKSIRLMNHQ